jgi:hypothetical protein
MVGVVAQGLTQLPDGRILPNVEVNKGICQPKFLLKLLASYRPAGIRHQLEQDTEGLFLQLDPHAVLSQFAVALRKLKGPEAKNAIWRRCGRQGQGVEFPSTIRGMA